MLAWVYLRAAVLALPYGVYGVPHHRRLLPPRAVVVAAAHSVSAVHALAVRLRYMKAQLAAKGTRTASF